MRFGLGHALVLVLVALLAAQPTLNVVCLAACEPASADAGEASHHAMAGACHEESTLDTRLTASGMSACEDQHETAAADGLAAVKAGREDTTASLSPVSIARAALRLPDRASISASTTHHASPPTPARSTIPVVLRI